MKRFFSLVLAVLIVVSVAAIGTNARCGCENVVKLPQTDNHVINGVCPAGNEVLLSTAQTVYMYILRITLKRSIIFSNIAN